MRATASNETRRTWNPATGDFGEHTPTGKTAPFLKGPIPLAWLNRAGQLPGKTLHVGVVLWYLGGLTKSATVRLGGKALTALGVSRDAKYDAVKRLREAGLISVEQRPGQAPLVTLLTIDH